MIGYYLVLIVIGYLMGCIECGYYISKIVKKKDIRDYGSHNSGATNMLRVFGWKYGLATFLGDALKAFIPVFLVKMLLLPRLGLDPYSVQGSLLQLVTGFAVVLGHNYPVNLKFKGGKGSSATGAVMMAYDWRMGCLCILIFVIVVALTRYVSLGSMLYSVAIVIEMAIFHHHWQLILFSTLFPIFSIYRHKANVQRLMSGTESKFGQKASAGPPDNK